MKGALEFGAVLIAIMIPTAVVPAPLPASDERRVCRSAQSILRSILVGEIVNADVLAPDPPVFPSEVTRSLIGRPRKIQLVEASDFWRSGWLGKTPSSDLVKRFYSAKYVSISVCFPGPSITEALSRLRKRSPDDGLRAAFNSLKIVAVTLPVLDASRSHALVLYSTLDTAGVGGKVQFVVLERQRSDWRVVGSRLVSVS